MTIDINHTTYLLFNVYMPVDTDSDMANVAEYCALLDEINAISVKLATDHILVGGDFNTDVSRQRSLHTLNLKEYTDKHAFVNGLSYKEQLVEYTYESKVNQSRSIIDHFI